MKVNEKVIARKLAQLNLLREDAPRLVLDWIISMRNLGLDVVVGPLAIGRESVEGLVSWQQRDDDKPWGLYWHPLGDGAVTLVDADTPLWIHRLILSKLPIIEGKVMAAIDAQIATFPQYAEIDPEFVPPENGLGRPEKT